MNPMLQDLLESPRFAAFSKWEKDFLLSIADRLDNGEGLTDKQDQKLVDIHKKYFG